MMSCFLIECRERTLKLIEPELLQQCRLMDVLKIKRQLARLKKISDENKKQQALQKTMDFAKQSAREVGRKASLSPALNYPEQLPVSQQVDKIRQAISKNQVVVIAGDTGSGKTTQLPKVLLELGLGTKGLIGHTQPRRLAARSVAQRIADELEKPLGDIVGYQVRFSEKHSKNTLVKLMTDGVLLSELTRDKLLYQYEAIIIDEAHERSLNIDFILGYLKQILPKRPDLKVIITSATIDVERFSKHFSQAPVVEVSGRTFPVETRYRPLNADEDTIDVFEGIGRAVDELAQDGLGDILVFLNGEREIRDATDFLTKKNLPHTEILPLYARLSFQQQSKIFASHVGRRIILSTNVAETSLTVPNIRYVIDTGTARISRYSYRTKVQRLPIEPISKASANQRQGRCGRVQEGVCIRLYSEEDFLSRPDFTDPEILRTNLASVILQMASLGLGAIEKFPFLQAPDARYIRDGMKLLEELHALESSSALKLTKVGYELSQLPMDPRLGRMILSARDLGCLHEVMVIASGLSIQDPRERPSDFRQKSDEYHARFKDKQSDFLAYMNLWRYLDECKSEQSQNQFRKRCQREFLSYLRIREWQDLYAQIKQIVEDMGMRLNQTSAAYEQIHQALLSGLLSHIGFKNPEGFFDGARQRKFYIFPVSGLAKKSPKWVMASELVETSRLFARICAQIQPEWIEGLAQHLVNRRYSEPKFDLKTSSVIAFETQSLYGLPIVERRKCQFGPIDARLAREIFIREGLVEAKWRCKEKFFLDNQALLDSVETLEHKSRRRDILVDEQQLFDFYDRRLPEGIYSAVLFSSWWLSQKAKDAEYLHFSRDDVMAQSAEHVGEHAFPDVWQQGALQFPLVYHFEPSSVDDGVSLKIPLAGLNQVELQGFDWLVPGLIEEKIIALIKGLPKSQRRRFVPAPHYAKACLEALKYGQGNLNHQLARCLKRMTGEMIEEQDFAQVTLPAHLSMNFQVVDDKKEIIKQSRNLDVLRIDLKEQANDALSKPQEMQKFPSGLLEWSFSDLEKEYSYEQAGLKLTSFLGLVDEKNSVAIHSFSHQEEAEVAHQEGIKRLLLLNMPSPQKTLQQSLSNKAKLTMYYQPWGNVQSLIDDMIEATVASLIQEFSKDVRTELDFLALKAFVQTHLNEKVIATALLVETILHSSQKIRKKLKGRISVELAFALSDIQAHHDSLIFPKFVQKIPMEFLAEYPRYLQAIEKRFEKLAQDPHRDRAHTLKVHQVQDAYTAKINQCPKSLPVPVDLKNIRWMIEELRVSFFAQSLGTKYPVSEKRILQTLKDF